MPTQHTFKQSNPNESTQFGVSHLRTRLNEHLDHLFFFLDVLHFSIFYFLTSAMNSANRQMNSVLV